MDREPADRDPPVSVDFLPQLLRSRERFLAYLTRRVASPADAEELLQEGFARAIARADSMQTHESASAWFYRVLHNAVIDYYRRRDSARRALDAEAGTQRDALQEPDSELESTVCACMHDLLPTLKPEYAEALQTVDLGETSVGEYAESHGLSRSNAGVRLHRARAALARSLIASCGSCATHGCLDCSCKR
jgi:RNA polymerase sigma factor (sigma-70 family)